MAGAWYDAVSGETSTTDTPARRFGSSRNISRLGADYNNQQTQFKYSARRAPTGARSVVVMFDVDALTNYGDLVTSGTAPSNTNCPFHIRLGNGSTDSYIYALCASATGYKHFNTSSNRFSAGDKNRFIGMTWANGTVTTAPIGYWDQFPDRLVVQTLADNGGTGTGNVVADPNPTYIGKRFDGVTQLDGAIYCVSIWERELSEAEMWALFRTGPVNALMLQNALRIWAPNTVAGPTFQPAWARGSTSIIGSGFPGG